MSRYILRDNYSGYIFCDSSDISRFRATHNVIADSLQAARMFDEDIGAFGRAYEYQRCPPRDTGTGYHVYRVSASYPYCDDGQDIKYITDVQRDAEFVGYVVCLQDV